MIDHVVGLFETFWFERFGFILIRTETSLCENGIFHFCLLRYQVNIYGDVASVNNVTESEIKIRKINQQ